MNQFPHRNWDQAPTKEERGFKPEALDTTTIQRHSSPQLRRLALIQSSPYLKGDSITEEFGAICPTVRSESTYMSRAGIALTTFVTPAQSRGTTLPIHKSKAAVSGRTSTMNPEEDLSCLTIGHPNLSSPVHTLDRTTLAPLVLVLRCNQLRINTGKTTLMIILPCRPHQRSIMVSTGTFVDTAGKITNLVRIMDNREMPGGVMEGTRMLKELLKATRVSGATIRSRRICPLHTLKTPKGSQLKTPGFKGQYIASRRHTEGSKTR